MNLRDRTSIVLLPVLHGVKCFLHFEKNKNTLCFLFEGGDSGEGMVMVLGIPFGKHLIQWSRIGKVGRIMVLRCYSTNSTSLLCFAQVSLYPDSISSRMFFHSFNFIITLRKRF